GTSACCTSLVSFGLKNLDNKFFYVGYHFGVMYDIIISLQTLFNLFMRNAFASHRAEQRT
ncbi:hypothetical protein, partial [uncultured Oscillibacter sp.]|uniref:hypothetical protein n=1 Tax=uncultured Oscillibacter sp. TaxID=876091 RepID=UPI00261D8A4A